MGKAKFLRVLLALEYYGVAKKLFVDG